MSLCSTATCMGKRNMLRRYKWMHVSWSLSKNYKICERIAMTADIFKEDDWFLYFFNIKRVLKIMFIVYPWSLVIVRCPTFFKWIWLILFEINEENCINVSLICSLIKEMNFHLIYLKWVLFYHSSLYKLLYFSKRSTQKIERHAHEWMER